MLYPRPAAGLSLNQIAEIVYRTIQAIFETYRRLPSAQFLARQVYIGLPLMRVVGRQRLEYDTRMRTREPQHHLGKFEHRKLAGVAYVDRPCKIVVGMHHTHHPLYQVVNILEAACLHSIAVYRYIFAPQCLHNKVRYHATVLRVHVGTVGIEYAYNLDAYIILPVIVHKKRFGATLPLIITRADAYGIDIAPVRLYLRMYKGVAIHLARRCLQYLGTHLLGQPQHIDGSHHRCFDGLYRIILIVDGRCRTCQIIYLVNLGIVGIDYIMTYQLEVVVAYERPDILFTTRKKVIEAYHIIPFVQQSAAQVRANKTGSARHQNPLYISFHCLCFII